MRFPLAASAEHDHASGEDRQGTRRTRELALPEKAALGCIEGGEVLSGEEQDPLGFRADLRPA